MDTYVWARKKTKKPKHLLHRLVRVERPDGSGHARMCLLCPFCQWPCTLSLVFKNMERCVHWSSRIMLLHKHVVSFHVPYPVYGRNLNLHPVPKPVCDVHGASWPHGQQRGGSCWTLRTLQHVDTCLCSLPNYKLYVKAHFWVCSC